MLNNKIVVTGALYATIAALFQLAPVFLSEVFVILTIFSALPIFIVTSINPKVGILSYVAASMIIMLLSVHEGLFFLFTNGIVGLSLGIFCYYIKSKIVSLSLSSIVLTISLCIINYGIGIPIFGVNIPGMIIIQIIIIFIFSTIYNIIYYYFSSYIFNLLKKVINFPKNYY